MSYLALYRKYRPKGFDGVIGQDHIVQTLINQIRNDRLGHAYLFTGTRGTGKTSLAKIFAKAINCTSPINGSPCDKCDVCLGLNDPSNVDIIEIDAASNNGVNEIRDLREKVQYPPVIGKYKVYIIDEVHMLSSSAFNALLKTLEEPPMHVVFILATTEVHKIPATILSRCMRFDFRLIPTEQICELICNIYDDLGKKYDKQAVYAIAKAGEGSIRDALSIADIALSYNENTLTYDDVMDILGSSNIEFLYEFVKNLLNGEISKTLSTINQLCELGKSINVLIKDITEILRSLLIIKTCDKPNLILNLPENKFNELVEISCNISSDRILRAIEVFTLAENQLKYSINPRVVLESSSIKVSKPETDYNLDAIMGRIKDIENKFAEGKINRIIDHSDKESFKKEQASPLSNEKSFSALSDLKTDELKGKLLYGLRKNGSEMLWNFMQDISVSINGNVLTVNVETSDDAELINKPENLAKIRNALSDYKNIEVKVSISSREKILSEIDDATEKIKKIFGSDIVIVKN